MNVVLSAAVVVLAACSSSRAPETPPSSPVHSLPSSGLLAAVDWSGGLCANTQLCRSGLSVDVDGTWHHNDGTRVTTGRLNALDLASLRTAVHDTALDTAPPFTGQCPVVYDGSEATYRFVRDGRTIQVASCTKEVPSTDPLATVLGRLFASTNPATPR